MGTVIVLLLLKPLGEMQSVPPLPAAGELRVQAGDNLGGNLRSHGESKGTTRCPYNARIGDRSTSMRTNTRAVFFRTLTANLIF
jgi:hypothetical protein